MPLNGCVHSDTVQITWWSREGDHQWPNQRTWLLNHSSEDNQSGQSSTVIIRGQCSPTSQTLQSLGHQRMDWGMVWWVSVIVQPFIDLSLNVPEGCPSFDEMNFLYLQLSRMVCYVLQRSRENGHQIPQRRRILVWFVFCCLFVLFFFAAVELSCKVSLGRVLRKHRLQWKTCLHWMSHLKFDEFTIFSSNTRKLNLRLEVLNYGC